MLSSTSCSFCGATNQPKASFCHACGRQLAQNVAASIFNTGTGQLLPSSTLNQRYRVLRPIGMGGMGAVYEAEDTQLGNRKVALKEMRQSGLNPQEITDAANAFRQEALLLAALQNPHLPNIYDHFSEFGRWYLVMSFIHGETLEDHLKKNQGGKLPLEEALQIGIQLCTVLGYLHAQQPPIIFRDLKPSNIMHTPDGHIYLIDFGIARLFKPGQTKDTSAYGSMGYASPEQYGRAQTTPGSDIYSLGAVLHQLISGYHPSSTPFRFPPLQTPDQTTPPQLVTLVEQMLSLDEGQRPTSMLIVKQKLQAIMASPAKISAIPPTVPASPTPLPPTVLATPSPLPPSAPATPPVAPKPPIKAPFSIATPAIKQPTSGWSIGKRQIVAMLVGTVMYSIATYLLDTISLYASRVNYANSPLFNIIAFNLSWFDILYTLALIIPIFFATKFGPWVGLVGILSASLIGDLLSGAISTSGFNWNFYAGVALLGFISGLAFLKTHGLYNTGEAIVKAVLASSIGIVVFAVCLIIRYSFSSFYLSFTLASIIITAIFLPILLRIYNK